MKVIDIIKNANVETVAKIIGATVFMNVENVTMEEAMKHEYPATLEYLQSEIKIAYVPTNADIIRAMSGEELEEFLTSLNEHCLAGIGEVDCSKNTGTCEDNCKRMVKNWLQAEIE